MKTLIVSDIHLTHAFDEKKYHFLESLFSASENIILNGDFWDGYSTTFDRFLHSKWSGLFPLLKSKKAIYLYGNHDKRIFSDERISLFSHENKDSHLLEVNSITYHVEHGHALCPAFDTLPLSRTFIGYVNFFTHIAENVLVRLGSPQNSILQSANETIKRKLKKNKCANWYLCGHTHIAEFDAKNKFANSGFIQYGKATYLIVDSSGPSLQTQYYK